MLSHPSGIFGDYISALKGCFPFKFSHALLRPPKLYFQSDLWRQAASSWALPNISSFFLFRDRIYELPLPIAVKLYHMMYIWLNFIN